MEPALTEILSSIPKPPSSGEARYYVRRVPGTSSHFFGWSGEGFPSLLLAAEGTIVRSPLRLAGIEVHFSIPCGIALPSGSESTKTLTAIRCSSEDSVVQGYFANVCESIIRIVGDRPTIQGVSDVVRHLIGLFQKIASPPTRSVRGLFGELYVIHISDSPATSLRAWHSAADDRFDFSLEGVRLEVKSAASRRRVHSFSLEQCMPPPGTLGILVSLFVESSGGGLSLLGLMQRIEYQLAGSDDLIMKLHSVIAETLGSATTSSLPMRFDEELAQSSIEFYELESIPAIRGCVPSEVSNVRFQADISNASAADRVSLISQNRVAFALLPANP